MSGKTRVMIVIGIMLLSFAIVFSAGNIGVLSQMYFGDGIVDFNELTAADSKKVMKKSMPVEGYIDYVMDCLAYSETEHQSYGITTSTTTDSYFYIILLDNEEQFMIVEAPYNSDLRTALDTLMYEEEYTGNYTEMSGVLVENDKEIVGFYDEWFDEFLKYFPEADDITLAPYTLDCRRTPQERCSQAIGGIVCWILFFIFIAIIVFVFVKSRNNSKRQAAYAAGGYSTPQTYNSGANRYDPTQPYTSGANRYDPTQPYTSGANSYDPTQPYTSGTNSYDPTQPYTSGTNNYDPNQTSGSNMYASPAQQGSMYTSAQYTDTNTYDPMQNYAANTTQYQAQPQARTQSQYAESTGFGGSNGFGNSQSSGSISFGYGTPGANNNVDGDNTDSNNQ